MQKKIIKTGIWFIVVFIWFGLWKLIDYKIDMYYAQVAPQQLDDDNAYNVLKFHETSNRIGLIVSAVIILLLLYRLKRIWFKTEPTQQVK